MPATTVISTVGTSLFFPNLSTLKADAADLVRSRLAAAYARKDWNGVANELLSLVPQERLCGAEINSLASLCDKQHVAPDANLFFCHSDTDDGRAIGEVLQAYYRRRGTGSSRTRESSDRSLTTSATGGHPVVELRPIADLQDTDPRRFRTRGLRNLAKEICAIIRDYGAANCAINATGGYKAQIAIAVLMGQALHVPVFYKHERFDEIIAFPPMPVSLDFDIWLRASGMLFDLAAANDFVPADGYMDDWDERFESLVEREVIDGAAFLELSPTGQIFHETFRERFRSVRDQILPPAALPGQKRPPRWEDSGHMRSHPEILATMQRLTDEIPQVLHCATFYFNPDLPARTGFRLGKDGLEGIVSNGTYTAKFRVETTAQTPGQTTAMLAVLNEWLRA